MNPTIGLIVFASLVATIQGFASKEQILKHLENLEASVSDHLDGAKLVIDDGQKKIQEGHADELKQSKLRNYHNTQLILNEASKRKCPVQLQEQIFKAADNVHDTWSDCMNFSQQIIIFENYTFAIYNDIQGWKPVLCDVANNVSLCFTSDGIITKISCFYDSVVASYDQFKLITDRVVELIHQINGLVGNTIDDFKQCFGLKEKEVKTKQLQLLNSCSPNGEDLSNKLL